MKRLMHIAPAEGGEDSKLFAADLAASYTSLFARRGWQFR
jgi:protein subunit release factor A